MLLEALVAVIALATLMIAGNAAEGKAPGTIYAEGLGRFLTVLIGEKQLPFAITFGAMAFSTFVLDTLDVATRLGRYLLQELFDWRGRAAALTCTLVTCAVPAVIINISEPNSYLQFWNLFGTSNQLLAALSLLGIIVWLKSEGRRYLFVALPMLFVLAVTVTALTMQIRAATIGTGTADIVNGIVAVILTILAASLVSIALRRMLHRQVRI
jgi:carbon starvation protein